MNINCIIDLVWWQIYFMCRIMLSMHRYKGWLTQDQCLLKESFLFSSRTSSPPHRTLLQAPRHWHLHMKVKVIQKFQIWICTMWPVHISGVDRKSSTSLLLRSTKSIYNIKWSSLNERYISVCSLPFLKDIYTRYNIFICHFPEILAQQNFLLNTQAVCLWPNVDYLQFERKLAALCWFMPRNIYLWPHTAGQSA